MRQVTITEKRDIMNALAAYVAKYPSRAKAAQSIGISAATMSALMGGKHELISDEMWRSVAAAVGATAKDWTLVETGAFSEISMALANAQEERNTIWIVGEAGCGKTTTARRYEAENAEVFYILCAEDMKKGDFVREIAQRIGCKTEGKNIRELWSGIMDAFLGMSDPLIIFDEADKLTESVFLYFISMYNRLEDHAGMAFLSTDYICRRMSNGLRHQKKGYNEFYSRIGRKYFELEDTTAADVVSVCRANGVTEEDAIKAILDESASVGFDLRRVKKSVRRTIKTMSR